MICRYCLIDKPATDFRLKRPNYCRLCLSKKNHEWRVKNKEKYRAYRRIYEKKYRQSEKHRSYARQYMAKWYEKNGYKYSQFTAEYHLKWRQDHPDGVQAHYLLNKAIRKGQIIKPLICQKCLLEKRLQAHHEDYKKPYHVLWLCGSCHRLQHTRKTA